MSSSKYGVLIGRIIKTRANPPRERTPHYKLIIKTKNTNKYDVNINCQSVDDKHHQVLYYVDDNFQSDITDILKTMSFGFHEIDYFNDNNSKIALDYIRSEFFDKNDMHPLPYDIKGENDLKGIIEKNVKKAFNNDKANIYVFGTHYPDNGKGMHNVHMNQGNRGTYYKENQIYHDGGFFIYFTEENRWVAYFFAFQNQSWHTNDKGCPTD